jgi:NADH:ubiquinone oxidoreductase subunit C
MRLLSPYARSIPRLTGEYHEPRAERVGQLYRSISTSRPAIVTQFFDTCRYEREVWDMYGVYFNHHPDLRRELPPESG